MKKAIILFLCIYSSINNFAQNESTKWYFGGNAALNFITNPPSVLNNSGMDAYQGCSSIADAAGNLLFYTDGVKIWDRQHSIMANGTMSIAGAYTGSYPLIVKQPGNSNLYYIFTVFPSPQNVIAPIPPPVITHGLYYSVVDMNLAAGLGSVIVNNALLYTGPFYVSTTGQLHATKHANGIDYWIMVHQYGNTNNFQAYNLTASGINPTPIVSTIGLTYQGGSEGYLKFSPTGQKLAISVSYAGVELYDFNTVTGQVSNPLTLLASMTEKNYHGCEFSPDGTKLYLGHKMMGSTNSNLIQWDLSAGSNSAIVSSSINLPSNSLNPQAMQLAPNGKIYIGTTGSSSLSVINNPNSAGFACNFIMNGQPISAAINSTLNSFSRSNLPSIITNTTNIPCSNQILNNPQTICSGQIYAIGNRTYSAANNYIDTLQNVFACNNFVIVNTQLTVNALPNVSITTNSIICKNDATTIHASGASTYTWNQNSTSGQFTTLPFVSTGNFIYTIQVQGTGTNGCKNTNIFSVNILVQACDVGIPEKEIDITFEDFRLFPNPTTEYLHLTIPVFTLNETSTLTVVNSEGKLISVQALTRDLNQIQTRDLIPGLYQLQIKTQFGTVTRRFVKTD